MLLALDRTPDSSQWFWSAIVVSRSPDPTLDNRQPPQLAGSSGACGLSVTDGDRMTTMRIVYFSDVHIETREDQPAAPWSDILPLGFGPELASFVGAADLLILAGDIGRVHSTRNVSPLAYARQAADFLGCG